MAGRTTDGLVLNDFKDTKKNEEDLALNDGEVSAESSLFLKAAALVFRSRLRGKSLMDCRNKEVHW